MGPSVAEAAAVPVEVAVAVDQRVLRHEARHLSDAAGIMALTIIVSAGIIIWHSLL